MLKTCAKSSYQNMHRISVAKRHEPRNRKNQQTKTTSSTYPHYVLHWLYFRIFFSRNPLLEEKEFVSEHVFLNEQPLGEIIFFFYRTYILQPRICPCEGSTCWFLHIPQHCKFLLPLVLKSRTFERTMALALEWCAHFTNFCELSPKAIHCGRPQGTLPYIHTWFA